MADEIESLRHDRARYAPPPLEVRGEVSSEVKEIIETLTERIETLEKAAAAAEAVEKVPEVKVERTAGQWVEDSNAAFALGNYQEAVEAYSKAIELDPVLRVAVVNEGTCKGCGACTATCRAGAMDLKGFRNDQIRCFENID